MNAAMICMAELFAGFWKDIEQQLTSTLSGMAEQILNMVTPDAAAR